MITNQAIDNIISENINKAISFLVEKKNKGINRLKRKYKDSDPKRNGETEKEYIKRLIERYRKEHGKEHRLKKRKLAGGGSIDIDYDEYQNKHKKVSAADKQRIQAIIDLEKKNIASVARDLFPDHTDEGAQSQLRKILNGEREMTDDIARKLMDMIDAGKIATK